MSVSSGMSIYERAENTEHINNFLPNSVLGTLMVYDEFLEKLVLIQKVIPMPVLRILTVYFVN